LNFSSKFIVFHGENGAGKTNVLEAISLFSSGRGLRKALLADLNSQNATPGSWNLELILASDQCKSFLTTNVSNGRRLGRIDGAGIDSVAQFEELLWILWVIPGMNNIFIGPAADRRSFFDHLVGGSDKMYKNMIKTLQKLQKERLHVLFHRKNDSWLEILEQKIAEENVKIIKSRLQFIKILEETFADSYSEFLRPRIGISGEIEKIYETFDEETSILEIADILKKNRFDDSEKQTTSIGSQKTFWQVNHPKTGLESEKCSTGEQKAFLVSLVLGVVRIYQKFRTGTPVLLLDDLMVYLDEKRRKNLIDELISLNIQTFFTGTDAYLFSDLTGRAQMYHVEKSICSLSSG